MAHYLYGEIKFISALKTLRQQSCISEMRLGRDAIKKITQININMSPCI